MKTLKIPESHAGISKTLRLPENVVTDLQALATLKNTSLNQITILLLNFALENLDESERQAIEKFKENK